MGKLRTFIAIDLPPETKHEIGRSIEFLGEKSQSQTPGGRLVWENPEKVHITLVFLGHIPQERMEEAARVAKVAAENSTEFELRIDGLSYFIRDKAGPDSIIFLDVQDREYKLRDLYKNLSRDLAKEGFWPPERLTPHITIGRLKGKKLHPSARKDILAKIAENEFPKIKPFMIDRINVYESISAPESEKSRYHLLKSFPLGPELTR